MAQDFPETSWALILGGSSGFGLATARKLARHGMNVAILHRDRRGAMARINQDFDKIRESGVKILAYNTDALDRESRSMVVDELTRELAESGKVRVLVHSIAFGNLKLAVAEKTRSADLAEQLSVKLGVEAAAVQEAVDELFDGGADALRDIASPPEYSSSLLLEEEDLERTVYAMGTSLLPWVQDVFGRGLFADDARVFGLTSEGNSLAWKGYAAVAAAKVALESIARAIAVEFAPHGIRANIIQAGVSDTPALRLIPGSQHLKAEARSRNPFGRLTTPEDVANAIYLLSLEEASWINGEIIRVDGGEHISGVRS